MKEILERLSASLSELEAEVYRDYPVSSRSSFKVGGIAALAVFPKTPSSLEKAVSLVNDAGVRYRVIGNASNVLFAFDRFEGAIIFTEKISEIKVMGNRMICDCGASLTKVASVAAGHGLTGMEFAYGIPAGVGGAVYMNAGAYGAAVSDVIEFTCAYDVSAKENIRIYDNGFGYRRSLYMENNSLICLGASFLLKKGDETAIRAKMAENIKNRREKQPLDYPSAGSYFKRPEGNFAGKLIEDCGLKGLRVGGAQVSGKHAGFIINVGGATYGDILELEEKIKESVLAKTSVLLEREVIVITD